MANRIQLRRDTADNWDRVNPILEDGEPGLDITHNQIKYGDGATRWRDLNFSGGLPQADGVVTFPGDFLIGTLHVDQPGSEKESVVWAKDDTEYLGLWWGGDQSYPESNYGPVAGIMIGDAEGATDDFTDNAAPNGTAITIAINDTDYPDGHRQTWVFAKDGNLTLPTGGRIGATKGGTMLDGGYGGSTSLTTFYASENYAACVTGFGNGTLDITTYKDGGVDPSRTWTFVNDGTLTLPGGSDIGYTPAVSTNITVNAKTWAFGVDGNLTLPAGGEIHSTAGTGNVTIQASDGSNPRNFVFDTDGSISLPHLATGSQGAGAFNAVNNLIALTSGDTVNFANFSGMILVNTHFGGGVTLYLCGGGAGNAVAIGDSIAGNSVGAMAHNAGIGGYTFTADETGDHVFCAIRTRTGA